MTTQQHTASFPVRFAAGAPTALTAARSAPKTSSVVLFLALHAPLALAMTVHPLVPTLHAAVTLLIGLRAVAVSRKPDAVLALLGYIVASEPLWRANQAMIFHETGKYALAGLAIFALVRFRLWPRADKTAFVYFVLLLPSLLVLPGFDRQLISFNLSGPFALAAATLLASAYQISERTLLRIFVMILAPILGMAFLGTVSMLATSEDINFYVSKLPSAGLGKNQASSALALAGLVAFLYLCLEKRRKLQKVLLGAVGIWCTSVAALTFSRGGVATTIGAITAAGFFLLRDRRFRGALVVRVLLILALAAYLVVPVLESVTSGTLGERFSDSDLTGRDLLIEADLVAFREHPLLGVGPGQSKAYHDRTFRRVAAHTEYSRMLAEHGLFGLASLLLLAWMVGKALLRPVPALQKAMAAGLIAWSLLFMFHAAVRMAAPCFTFAIGIALLGRQAVPRREGTARPRGPRGESKGKRRGSRGNDAVRFWDRRVPQADRPAEARAGRRPSPSQGNSGRAST